MIPALIALTFSILPWPVFACEQVYETTAILDDGATVSFQAKGQPPAVGRHFSLLFQFCRDGQPLPVDQFNLDADMPAHGHGMNYRSSIRQIGPGRFEASGLLFHMPGQWELLLDVAYDQADHRFRLDYSI